MQTESTAKQLTLTVNSNKGSNFVLLHPGELKQFSIRSIDAPTLFFKVSSATEIKVATLDLNQLPALITSIDQYESSFSLNTYQNLYEEPTKLKRGADYTIKLIDDRV